MKTTAAFKIDESQRQNWLSIAAVWAGGMICVPCLMIGGVLAGGGRALAGRRIHPAGLRHDLRLHDLHRYAGLRYRSAGIGMAASGRWGKKGALHYFDHCAIACVGWFGIQSATCGSAFASMVANMLG